MIPTLLFASDIAVTKAKEYVNIDAEAVVCSLDV